MHQYATICIQSYIIGIMRMMVVGFVGDVRRSVGWWESMVQEMRDKSSHYVVHLYKSVAHVII
jgi:hypothetical protein